MKNIVLSVLIAGMLLLGMMSCATTGGENSKVVRVQSGSGDIFDINTGAIIGSYSLDIADKVTSVKVKIGATKAITSMDGTKDFKEFEGEFSGSGEEILKGNQILKLASVTDKNLFLVTTVEIKEMLPKALKANAGDKVSFTLSVMDADTAKVVFDKSRQLYSPALSVYAIKTFMVTQALILQ